MNPGHWIEGSATVAALAAAVGQLAGALVNRNGRTQPAELASSSADAATSLGVLLDELRDAVQTMNKAATGNNDDVFEQANRDLVDIACSIDDLLEEVGRIARPASLNAEGAPVSWRWKSLVALPAVLQQATFPDGAKRARIFMSTGLTFDASGQAYTIRIVGNEGTQQLTFASGTAQYDMITAINQFLDKTGVYALQEPRQPAWIRLTSRKRGPDQFVAAKKIQGNLDNMLRNEWGGNPSDRQVDFGE